MGCCIALDADVYELRDADLIWNRACLGGGAAPHAGDRALADLLRAHGLVMNGGVLHAVECLTAAQRRDAAAGYRFFGLELVSELLFDARRLFNGQEDLEAVELKLNKRYAELVPDDACLAARFETHLRARPSDFAPLRRA